MELEIYIVVINVHLISLKARLKKARSFSMNSDINYVEASLIEGQIKALADELESVKRAKHLQEIQGIHDEP